MTFITRCSLAVVASASMAGASAGAQDPALADLLARAAQAASAFTDTARIIYCEEHYKPNRYGLKQNMELQYERVKLEARPWVAEFAIAAGPELERLGFDGNTATTAQSAQAQLGPLGRPALLARVVALFLHTVNQPRFVFELGSTRTNQGVTLREIRFETRPGRMNLESPLGIVTMPASGSFWVDQATGSVHLSMLKFADVPNQRGFNWMSLTFGAHRATGLWLPESMEHHLADRWASETIEGRAEYKNCRAVARAAR